MSVVTFALEGFEMQPSTSSTSNRRDVYRMGAVPAVIVIHEMPGITPLVAAFARRVADRGMTAVLPDLLGTPGRPVTIPYALASLARACVSKEFTLLALNKTSPIVDYLRELAAHEHQSCGGPGVGKWPFYPKSITWAPCHRRGGLPPPNPPAGLSTTKLGG